MKPIRRSFRSCSSLLAALAPAPRRGQAPRRHHASRTSPRSPHAIGGDRVETFALAKGYQDPHFVDAKPSFVLQLSRADLLIVAGLELEIGYLPPLLDQSRNAQDPSRRARLPRRLGRLRDPRAADARRSPAPWATSTPTATRTTGPTPRTAGVIARAIAARLAQLDPAGRGGLRQATSPPSRRS